MTGTDFTGAAGIPILALLLVLQGCASKPPLMNETLRANINTAAISPTRLVSGGWEIDATALEKVSAAAYATRGAGKGALTAADILGSGSCAGSMCGGLALIWVAGLAIGAVAGVLHGAHTATAEAERRRQNAPSIRSFQDVAASLDAATDMYADLRSVLAANNINVTDSGGADAAVAQHPSTSQQSARFALDTQLENIHFIEVKARDGASRFILEVFLRYRLIDHQSGSVAYESFAYAQRGPLPLDRWADRDAQRFRELLHESYVQLAETVMDDLFLVVRSNQPDIAQTEYATGYFLDPVRPPRIKRAFPVRSHDIGFGFAGTQEIRSHTPRLTWSAIPHRSKGQADDWATMGITPAAIRYDVRVFGADGEIARANDLPAPTYQLPAPLAGCRGYFWTFRARFTLDGRTRVTDWAGDFNGMEPWNSRYPEFPGVIGDRDEVQGMLDRVPYYHRFWVMQGPGEACE